MARTVGDATGNPHVRTAMELSRWLSGTEYARQRGNGQRERGGCEEVQLKSHETPKGRATKCGGQLSA